MQINNPFQMNDWDIEKFLKIILTIQLALWGVIGLEIIGLHIPIVRQLISFIYLAFVPGILILRIIRLHKLGNTETLLYMVGLSITTLMFMGLFMNTVYPFLGISGPISITPLLITISAVVLCLCYISYKRDKYFSDPSFIEVKDVLSPSVLFLCLIPFLSIFGACLVNFHYDNRLLIVLIVLLAIINILIAFDKFIPKKLYPFAVFIIAISLLYHKSLISMYLWGTDIHAEHYLCNLTMWNSHWDSTIAHSYNAMLSIMMLAPIFSEICGISITWVFKIIYPLVFAFVPLGLYRVFQKQTNDKIAFLSCFFFMAAGPFYIIMLWVPRQQIAELFLVLLILLMVAKDMDRMKRSFLLITFGFSLAVSHYGAAYIYMFSLIFAWLILVLMENPDAQRSINNFYSKFSKYWNIKVVSNSITSKTIETPMPLRGTRGHESDKAFSYQNRTISSTFVRLFVVFTLTWYMYVSSSAAFDVIVSIGNQIRVNIFDLFKPSEVEALYMIFVETSSPLHRITKYLHLLTQFFISVGILSLLLGYSETKFEDEYSAFSLIFFGICLASLVIPFTSTQLGTTRVYLIILLFLAPFCAIGCIIVFRMLSKVVRMPRADQYVMGPLKVFSILLAIFLLFNTGLVYEVAKDDPTSISLNTTIKHPRFYFNEQEAYGAQWVANTAKKESDIYAGDFGRFILWDFVSNKDKVRVFNNETIWVSRNSYIFMGLLNVRADEVVVVQRTATGFFRDYPKLSNSTFYNDIVIHANKIYDTGDAQVYYHS